jgi:hypothetical protein
VLFAMLALVFCLLGARLVLQEFGRAKSAGDQFLDGYAHVLEEARRALADASNTGQGSRSD